jgi:hypothetical protein
VADVVAVKRDHQRLGAGELGAPRGEAVVRVDEVEALAAQQLAQGQGTNDPRLGYEGSGAMLVTTRTRTAGQRIRRMPASQARGAVGAAARRSASPGRPASAPPTTYGGNAMNKLRVLLSERGQGTVEYVSTSV